jgi:hypothetical protein
VADLLAGPVGRAIAWRESLNYPALGKVTPEGGWEESDSEERVTNVRRRKAMTPPQERRLSPMPDARP